MTKLVRVHFGTEEKPEGYFETFETEKSVTELHELLIKERIEAYRIEVIA